MPRESVSEFGQRLKAARNEKQLSQATLAEMAGTTQVHIARLESESRTPSLWLARRIADALGVSLDALAPALSAGEISRKNIQ